MDFIQWLAANGYDAEKLNEAQRKHLTAAWQAEAGQLVAKPPAPTVAETYDQEVAAARRENERLSEIRDITAKAIAANVSSKDKIERFDTLCKTAIESKWTLDKFRVEMMREERAIGPMILVPQKEETSNAVVEAAICQAGGLKGMEKAFDPRTLEGAHSQFRSGIGLHEMIAMCARQHGWRGTSVRSDLRGALRAASMGSDGGSMMSVGPSTLDITGILSNVANKFVREAFMFIEDVWSRIAAIRPVNDFKQISTYSLTGDNTYEKVAPGGEIKEGTLGETSYTNKADTYAKLLGIDRRDMINDDLNALSSASRRLGRGGALKLCDVFWTEFLDNASFYTTGNLNYDDGASDTLMDLTGLANAHTLFMNQQDPDGKPMGAQPAIVLVPPQLFPAAWVLLISAPPGDTTATKSPWTGMFRLEQSRYLANSSFAGYSTKAWYMIADPNDVPVIEVCFLNGKQMPTIETGDVEFDRLGIALRGYHDFGVKKQEYRGGVKLKGEN